VTFEFCDPARVSLAHRDRDAGLDMKLRIVVVEDEEIIARRLIRLVRKLLGDRFDSIHYPPTLESAQKHLADHPIDLLLLDLDLHGRSGFGLLMDAAAGAFQTIIVSARHDEALRAFEFGVLDFIAKGYVEARVKKALDRVANAGEPGSNPLVYLAVRKVGGIVPVRVEDVVIVRGADDYSEIH
jgi:two-component system response regulator LytT